MSSTSSTPDSDALLRHDSRRRTYRRVGAVTAVLSLVAGVVTINSAAAVAATPATVTVTGAQFYGTAAPAFASTATANGTSVGVKNTATCTKVSTGATIDTNLPVGAYTIDPASCSGATFPNPSLVVGSYLGGTFTVSKSTLTVTADSKTRVYGGSTPVLTWTITGFLNGDTAAGSVSGNPNISTAVTPSTPVGSYPINISNGGLTSSNYKFTFVAGTFTVTPIQVDVKVSGAQLYGGTPAFAATTSQPGVTAAGITCTTVNSGTSIAPTLAFGGYTIDPSSCSGAALSTSVASPDPNYAVRNYLAGTAPSFTVFKAGLTVTADAKTRPFGAANPPLTYTVTGFVNGEDASVLTGAPILSTNAVPTSHIGNYPVSISQGSLADTNYSFTLVPGTLAVTTATTAVTVTGAQNYGSSAVGFSAASTVNGVTISGASCTTVNNGTPISPSLPVGTYTIDASSCSGGTTSSPDYTIGNYVGGSFSVFKVALTFTADNKSRIFGAPNPTFTYTVSGFVNGDDASVITGTPGLLTTATTSSHIGQYVIGIGGNVSAANYRIVFVNGTLTIDQAPLVVSVTGAQVYGSSNYGIAASATVNGVSGPVAGVNCTTVNGGTAISPTLNFGGYTIDGGSCSGGTLSNSDYTISSYTGNLFSVFKAQLTVTANDANKVYGSANPSFSATFSGFQNSDTATVLTGSLAFSTTATTTSPVANYPITPSVGTLRAQNYFFTFVPGTLTVTQYPVVVTVTGAQNYGSTAQGFAAKSSVAGITATGGACTTVNGGTPVDSTLSAGGYTLDTASCSGATLSDPNFMVSSYVGSTYTVFRVKLTGTANPATKVYGTANPAFSASYSGFVNGDTAAVVGGTPTFSTTATAASGVGTYPITIGAGSLHAANYFFALANGSLTVTPAPLTVTAHNATRAYGSANPAFTSVITGFVNGDTASVVSGSAALSTPATTASDVGTYPINAALGTLHTANYTFGFAAGTLTITQATPSIATTTTLNNFVSATLTYGASSSPVVGQTVTFTMNKVGTALCTATTDANGLAKCTPPSNQHLNVVLNGYVAAFAGSLDFAPVSKIEK